MAYMSQQRKQELAPTIKSILAKYGVKGTLAVRNHSTLVLNIKSGKIDFINNFNEVGRGTNHRNYGRPWEDCTQHYLDVNPYWYHEHFSGKAKDFLADLLSAMNMGNHDNSDIQTDYFDVGWYVDVHIGNWNKPYVVEKS